MRTYGQYCAIAKSLDVVGDRWTLLIVRELLLRGPSRYSDIREGLPGIATNLLASRLRELEQQGVLSRRQAPPPIAATLFELTERGRALEPVLDGLMRWGVPYMAAGPCPGDAFRSRWIMGAVELFLEDREPQAGPIALELNVDGEPITVEAADGAVGARPGAAENPAASMSATPHTLLGLLSGNLDLAQARGAGLQFSGSEAALARLQPAALP